MPRLALGAVLVTVLSGSPAAGEGVRSLTEIATTPPALGDLLAPPPPASESTLEAITRAGLHRRLDTERGPVHVWVPAGYEPSTAATVVFVHGYHTDIDTVWRDYRLPEQFALSGINAMFIAGAAPSGKRAPVAWPSLNGLLAAVAASVDVVMPKQRLIAVGHSGAYRTLALWLANRRLDSVVLLDAVYGEYRFGPWVRARASRRLINIAYETGRYSDIMHRSLPTTVRVDGFPADGFPDARILYVKTDVGHWAIATDGVALPMALRALGVPRVPLPVELPLGLPLRCDPKPDATVSRRPSDESTPGGDAPSVCARAPRDQVISRTR